MSHWNYRIIHFDLASPDETWMAVHEVYYDNDGQVTSYAEKGATVGGEGVEEIERVLEIVRGALARPVLIETELRRIFQAKQSPVLHEPGCSND